MKTFTLCLAMLAFAGLAKAQDEMTVIYSNNFSEGTVGDCTIVGNGAVVECSDEGHIGYVYKNGISDTSTPRTNYLVLPSTVFADFDGQHGYNTLKVTVDVKLREEAIENQMFYFYCPLFSAYTQAPHIIYYEGGGQSTAVGNELPMLICQSRCLLQLNCYGWSDFGNHQNVAGSNVEDTSWANDGNWHSYEFVISTGTCYVKVDDETINEWYLDGTYWTNVPTSESDPDYPNTVNYGGDSSGLFTNGSELVYVCLGGNQAWEWGDIDMPYYFDNLVISAGQTATASIDEIEAPAAEVVSVEYFNLSGAKISEPGKGITIEKTTYTDGTTSVNKILK